MVGWREEFSKTYKTTTRVKRLNKEIQDAKDHEEMQKKVDQAISNELRDKRLRKIIKKG